MSDSEGASPVQNSGGKFDLFEAIQVIENDVSKDREQLAVWKEEILAMRSAVVQVSRTNFTLERELVETDERIKLHVKNRSNISSETTGKAKLEEEKVPEEDSGIVGKVRSAYEHMFFILQNQPGFLGQLAFIVPSELKAEFVQTVVFDMFGDQYDSREERLLLAVFVTGMEVEISRAEEMGSLFRANTAFTQILSAYARRGAGLLALRTLLDDFMKNLEKDKTCNLELNPNRIYNQLISDYETNEGTESPLPKGVDDSTAAANEQVQQLTRDRIQRLEEIVETLLETIFKNYAEIPYGMRYICQQIRKKASEKFATASKHQIYSLVGGFIFLRFITPVIVAPVQFNLLENKPSKTLQKNLVMVAKVIMNLSNGISFGAKESYMMPMNRFLEQKKVPMEKFFEELCQIEDIQAKLKLDRLLSAAGHRSAGHQVSQLNLSYNQVFMMHTLLEDQLENLEVRAGEGTAAESKMARKEGERSKQLLRSLLKQLGKAPAQRKIKENKTVLLYLHSKNESQEFDSQGVNALFEASKNDPRLYVNTKNLLFDVLKSCPKDQSLTQGKNLLVFLQDCAGQAKRDHNKELAEKLANLRSMLISLWVLKRLPEPNEGGKEAAFDNFLWNFAEEVKQRPAEMKLIQRRLKMITKAKETIESHQSRLNERLEVYNMYLANVRKGQQSEQQAKVAAKHKKSKNHKKSSVDDSDEGKSHKTTLKFTHDKLEQLKLIMSCRLEVKKAIVKKLVYTFTEESVGQYKVQVSIKKGIEIKLPMQPWVIGLEELLVMQEEGKHQLKVDLLTLNVNILIHILNKSFLTAR